MINPIENYDEWAKGGFKDLVCSPGYPDPNTPVATKYVPGGSTPQQYGLPEGATELQDLIEFREMNFAVGNIFKSCYRLGNCSHSDRVRDLNKILWFTQRELKRSLKGE